LNERPETGMPFGPVRLSAEIARGLAGELAESARECLGSFVTRGERNLAHRHLGSECQPPGRPPHPYELNVAIRTHAEEARELPVEVVTRECRDAAQVIDRKGGLGIRLDAREHSRETLLVALDSRRKLFAFTHGPHFSRARATRA